MNLSDSRDVPPTGPSHTESDLSESGAPLTRSLLSIAKSTRAFLALLLAEADLHPGQDQLLVQLQPNALISVSRLADRLAVRPSTVSKMLDRLIEKEFVVRQASDSDGRRTMVLLTSRGEKARAQVLAIWDRVEAELGDSLDEAGRAELAASLAKADEILSRRLRRLR
ncbi:MarR family winged helix-turn-helix transcriptional regulator [Consotaella aegiceratis]|uniref:MarR family winged helix-turn-helix transcriptional regulator n=1 Tax=Consotaella aegiceratis TaxID=3097961 RepID=UPI002F428558